MTIKTRIILGFSLTILIMLGGIVPYVVISMRNTAEESYLSSSSKQLQIMDSYVSAFLKEAQRNAAYLSGIDSIRMGLGLFPNFINAAGTTTCRHDSLSPEAQAAVKPILRMHEGNNSYEEIYLGYLDGSYASSIPEIKMPAGFNSTKRAWYIKQMSANSNVGLADGYLSHTGNLVIAATHKIYDLNGRLTGAMGIDVSLNELSNRFKSFNFGDTGYFLLIENTGRILCHPRNQNLTGKIIGKDVNEQGLMSLFNTKNGALAITLQGEAMRANVLTTDFGWKIVALQAENEIFSASNAAIRSTALISVGIALTALLLACFIVASINRPLRLIVNEADKIAQGDLKVRLDENAFYGELSELRSSLANMVNNLRRMIETAEQKSKEAEANSAMAKSAVEEAQRAHLEAEQARKDGMLSAAAQLQEAVSSISKASEDLTRRIGQAENICAESANRLQSAATAMYQMSAAVREVAGSASSASSMSDETKANAEGGANIVQNALRSIGNVQHVSVELKNNMAQLNEHAQNINRIMGVIFDIADQTNLLALNAAIEAARAGEAGRGFAVVADEVRKLAEKTTASTHDVSGAIKAIQESMVKSLAGMDNALEQVEAATSLSSESGKALRQIVANVDAMADQVRAIATASEEQSSASESINQSIATVNEMAAGIAKAMSEAGKDVSALARQTQKLSGLIDGIKKG